MKFSAEHEIFQAYFSELTSKLEQVFPMFSSSSCQAVWFIYSLPDLQIQAFEAFTVLTLPCSEGGITRF